MTKFIQSDKFRKLTTEKMSLFDGTCFYAAMHWISKPTLDMIIKIPSEMKA